VATLKPLKRIDLLLEAARAVLEDTHDVTFVIVGEGGEHDRLASQAVSLGIADQVVFTGFRNDIGRILRSSDLFVLPSRTEAFPNVVLEAMASGLPVVATDVGSVGEMVEDGRSGVMVPAGDVGALQEAVKALLGDTERMRAFGDRGRKIVEEKYTLEQMCSKREALFSELLCRKSSGPS
jgi:glycosyltransferase involved in cell wall biosynthesis